jgi:hypothetical protein
LVERLQHPGFVLLRHTDEDSPSCI